MKNSCRARQYSDSMHCAPCGLTWDMNDPDPPTCGTLEDTASRVVSEIMSWGEVPPGPVLDPVQQFKKDLLDKINAMETTDLNAIRPVVVRLMEVLGEF